MTKEPKGSTRSTSRRQIGTILLDRSFQNKNFNTMASLIASGFVSVNDAEPFLALPMPKHEINKVLTAIGPERIPPSVHHAPAVKAWFLTTPPGIADLVRRHDMRGLKKLPRYMNNRVLHTIFETYTSIPLRPKNVLKLKKAARTMLERGASMDSVVDVGGVRSTLLTRILLHIAHSSKVPERFGSTVAEQASYFIGAPSMKLFDIAVGLGATPTKKVNKVRPLGYWNSTNKGTLLHVYTRLFLSTHRPATEYDPVLRFLLNHGISINATDSTGSTVLHDVARRVHYTSNLFGMKIRDSVVMETLVIHGALYDLPNAIGRTARSMVPEHSWLFTAADLKSKTGTKRKR